ncbi:MAG: DMP19 family protein [Rubripirellula sp.]
MSQNLDDQSVIVSEQSFESDDPYDIIYSSVSFLNALMEQHFREDELATDALRSYYVDLYVSQMNNGGFSQFVYNSRWEESLIQLVRDGLKAMGADRHLALFDQSSGLLEKLGEEGLMRFFESEYFGENADRDALSENDEAIYDLMEEEDLIELNSAWLRGLEHLVVMPRKAMQEEILRRVESMPDRAERWERAKQDEPRYIKLVRALCDASEHELSRVTAGDPNCNYEGQQVLAWHFVTDKGHHYMVDLKGVAMMFQGDTHEKIIEIEASDEYGEA